MAIHQIPVSLSMASMLRESLFRKKTQILLVVIFALAAPLGFLISGKIIDISPVFISLATALAGGSLLYVSNVELLPMIHAQSNRKMKYITVALFVIGVVGMSMVKIWE